MDTPPGRPRANRPESAPSPHGYLRKRACARDCRRDYKTNERQRPLKGLSSGVSLQLCVSRAARRRQRPPDHLPERADLAEDRDSTYGTAADHEHRGRPTTRRSACRLLSIAANSWTGLCRPRGRSPGDGRPRSIAGPVTRQGGRRSDQPVPKKTQTRVRPRTS